EGSGKFNAMAIDLQGRIHLAYANVSANTAGLRYASWDGKAWHAEIVEGQAQNHGESVGYSVVIAADHEGNPHIAYMNESSPALKYAVRSKDHWEIQTVDRVTAVGYPDRNSIALDDEGRAY